MQRDLDLIRVIALRIEEAKTAVDSSLIAVQGHSNSDIGKHCALMVEAGLIDTINLTHLASDFPGYRINGLTWKGHDFVDAARNETTWNKALVKVKTQATGFTFAILLELLKQQVRESLGLPLGL